MSYRSHINTYLNKCTDAMNKNNEKEMASLIVEIVNVFENHIPNIYNGLSSYIGGDNDYQLDIRILKSKLRLMKSTASQNNLHSTTKKDFIINNLNENRNVNTSHINISFEQVKQEIINNKSLHEDQIKEIIGKIAQIEDIYNSDESMNKKWSALRDIMNWISTKGVDIATKILPLVLNIILHE